MFLPLSITRAPRAWRVRAIAFPMPPLAPVRSTLLPASCTAGTVPDVGGERRSPGLIRSEAIQNGRNMANRTEQKRKLRQERVAREAAAKAEPNSAVAGS